jgi:hypothetical protein
VRTVRIGEAREKLDTVAHALRAPRNFFKQDPMTLSKIGFSGPIGLPVAGPIGLPPDYPVTSIEPLKRSFALKG